MSTTPLKPGTRINGKYEIQEQIGAGAHGTVYRAIQHPVGRLVALKFISRHLSKEPENRARFLHEAQALARLSHPAVVTLFDYGESDGQLFMAMEYIEGAELTELIDHQAPLDTRRSISMAEQILEALIEAHEMGLVHRDLKPANIMVYKSAAGDERVKILDFGISGLREDAQSTSPLAHPRALGTPGYSAPEQCLGQPVGPGADIYSLGVMLYEMLAGRPPFVGPNAWMLIERHLNESVPTIDPSLNVPSGFESLVRLALAKSPDARFPDTRSMLRRLLEVQDELDGYESTKMPTFRELEALDSDRLAELSARLEERSDTIPTTIDAQIAESAVSRNPSHDQRG